MIIFDANMILRYLLNDIAEMADEAEHYINTDEVLVTTEVIAEVVYVLGGVYSMPKDKIVGSLVQFLELVTHREKILINYALETYRSQNLDFVDCVLYAYNKVNKMKVATFDRKLLKLLNS